MLKFLIFSTNSLGRNIFVNDTSSYHEDDEDYIICKKKE